MLPQTLHVIPGQRQSFTLKSEYIFHHLLSRSAFLSCSSADDGSDVATEPAAITIVVSCMKLQRTNAITRMEMETEGAMLQCMIDEWNARTNG